MVSANEDLPLLYPAAFWAAYNALARTGVAFAQIRAHVAEQVIALLIARADVSADATFTAMTWTDIDGIARDLRAVNYRVPNRAIAAAIEAATTELRASGQ